MFDIAAFYRMDVEFPRENDIYEMKLLMEPTGNSEKCEPQMGFEPTTILDLFVNYIITQVILQNHYVHPGSHEMRTHRRRSVHSSFAVGSAVW